MKQFEMFMILLVAIQDSAGEDKLWLIDIDIKEEKVLNECEEQLVKLGSKIKIRYPSRKMAIIY